MNPFETSADIAGSALEVPLFGKAEPRAVPPHLANPRETLLRRIRNALLRNYMHRKSVRWHGVAPHVTGMIPRFSVRGGEITFGSKCRISSLQYRSSFTARNGTISVGDQVGFGCGVNICSLGAITIGSYSRFGPQVVIYDTHFHALSPHQSTEAEPVSIGRNVWVATRAIVLPGVTIGDHAVIGAGSVVTRDIPQKTFWAGAPARFIRNIDCADDWIRE